MKNLVLTPIAPELLVERISEEVTARLLQTIKEFQKQHQPQPQEEKLLTIDEASVLLSLTVPTIYSKVSRNELPYMKRGKRLYFSDKELREYIKGGKRKSNAELDAEASDYLLKKGGINAL